MATTTTRCEKKAGGGYHKVVRKAKGTKHAGAIVEIGGTCKASSSRHRKPKKHAKKRAKK